MRNHEALRRALAGAGIRQSDLAGMLMPPVCAEYVSKRMNGKKPWRSDHMYQILEIVGEDATQLHRLFPKDGVQLEKFEPTKRRIIDRSSIFAY